MDFSKFDLLETRLSSLLERLKALESDNAALKGQLGEARQELETAQRRVTDLTKARETVVTRIDALLERMTQAGLPD
ncbi:MAG: cell division protein ZapB [Deltaproteobacteria bacterium]|jgi:chromosome segregation ATPase|nr:cell division protein ZapB [Deltaproteobacteria bacterium]